MKLCVASGEEKRPWGVVFNHFSQWRMIVVPSVNEGDVQCRCDAFGANENPGLFGLLSSH